jgi:hypothetical protein
VNAARATTQHRPDGRSNVNQAHADQLVFSTSWLQAESDIAKQQDCYNLWVMEKELRNTAVNSSGSCSKFTETEKIIGIQ